MYNGKTYFLCDAKNKPNEIFENGNIIITFGKEIMEVFEFTQNNDNSNNLIKKYEININNNEPNNNNLINNDNNNNNNDNEILCCTLAKGFIICGHKNGLRSIWKPTPNIYLKKCQEEKLHNGAINKILYTQLSDNLNYLISCSSDQTIKVYCMEKNKVELEKKFDNEVMDIKLVKDFDKQSIFILSLKNGVLECLNEKFEFLYNIPSRYNTTTTRYIIPLQDQFSNQNNDNINNNNNLINEQSSNNKGDLLVITEGKILDIFNWIKEENFKNHQQHNNNNYRNNFHPGRGRGNNINPHYQFYQGPPFFQRDGY